LMIADGHAHVNPLRGLSARELAERFLRSGGWFIALVSVSPWDYGLDVTNAEAAYRDVLRYHESACREAREAGLKVACVAGFHPADVDKLVDSGLRSSEVLNLGLKVLDYITSLCRSGRLDGIGEIGRQHYRTIADRVLVSELILEEAVLRAQELGCAVHLHLEDVGPETVSLTHRALSRLGIKPSPSTVFHHAKPSMVREALSLGYSITVPGRTAVIAEAIKYGDSFMVESDFPGVEIPRALRPWDLAAAEEEALRGTPDPERVLRRINVEAVVRAYGVEPP